MVIEHALERIDQVLHEVKAISDLDSVRCAGAGALSIDLSTVASDDFDARVRLQPVGERFAAAFCQQIDGLMSLQIDQDRAIRLAFVFGPVIYAQYSRCRAFVDFNGAD